MAAEVSSIARLLRGDQAAGKKAGEPREIVTMDLLGRCGGGGGGGSGSAPEDEVVDLEVTVPAGWERRLDLQSGKTFLTPRTTSVQAGSHRHNQDLNMPPPAAPAPAPAAPTPAVCTLDMVRSALERAAAGRTTTASPATSASSSASTSSSSSAGKRHRSPPTEAPAAADEGPAMRAGVCPSCLTFVLISEADPSCPRCSATVPPLVRNTAAGSSAARNRGGKKPKIIDLNAAADEAE